MICKSVNLGVSGFAVKGIADSVRKQLTAEMGAPASEILDSDCALWHEIDGQVASFLVWREWLEDDALFIVLAWTQIGFRCQGLYRQLFDLAKEEARALGFSRVICGIAPRNILSREVHEGMGMKAVLFEVTI